jgi:hypothetical protein
MITTNQEALDRFCAWVSALNTELSLGLTAVIQSHQDGVRPSLPYLMAYMMSVSQVTERERNRDYLETVTPNSAGELEVLGIPWLDTEWTFGLHAYSLGDPTEVLRQLRSISYLPQLKERASFFPDFDILDFSPISYLPELVENRWEPRAITKVRVHGVTLDSYVVDVVDIAPVSVERF